MTLKQRIENDMKAALLGGDRFVGEVLRGLKAAILNEEISQNNRDEGLSDEAVEQVIAREVKKRNESATMYEQNDRLESADTERREAAVMSAYLPKQLSEHEIQEIVDATIEEMGATGMQSMGLVIGAVKQKVGNTADGATVARVVKQALSEQLD